MARLRLDDVTKTFPARGRRRPAVAALRSIELDVPDAATLAIVGPSGCGKTTLLRTVAGLERPDRGRVRFDDRDVTALSVSARAVGFVFQSLALFEHLDVRTNIGYGVRGTRERRAERVRSAAARARVGDVMDESPRRLSGGERQRVAIARALAIEPSIFVLDEPFASLDAPLRVELRLELARSRREFGTTTILVTHDRADAFVLGDLVAVMDAGRIVQVDTPEALVDRPATRFVASFLGAPGLSLIEGRVEDGIFLAPGGIAIALAGDVASGTASAGVRAEAVRFVAGGALAGRIAVIERDGAGAVAHVDGLFGTLVARMPPEGAGRSRVGDLASLTIEPGGTHVFARDGSRLATA